MELKNKEILLKDKSLTKTINFLPRNKDLTKMK
jgi:hypothetical protein